MNKKIPIVFSVLFFLFAVPAIAADLTLSCSPTSAAIADTISCDLSFVQPQSFLSLQGTLEIPSPLKNSVTFSNLPNNNFKATYDQDSHIILISDEESVVGVPSATKIATLSFTAQTLGTGKIILTVTELLKQDFVSISLLSDSIESDTITVQVCEPQCTGKQCGDDGCDGSCGTCEEGYTCTDEGLCSETIPCTDSDKGLDYVVTKGTVISPKYPDGKEDFCYTFPSSGKTYLMEGECVNNEYGVNQYNCAELNDYICQDGACISTEPTEICNNNADDDNDGKIDCFDIDCAGTIDFDDTATCPRSDWKNKVLLKQQGKKEADAYLSPSNNGTNACQSVFQTACLETEYFSASQQKWVGIYLNSCDAPLFQYEAMKHPWRAVCEEAKEDKLTTFLDKVKIILKKSDDESSTIQKISAIASALKAYFES